MDDVTDELLEEIDDVYDQEGPGLFDDPVTGIDIAAGPQLELVPDADPAPRKDQRPAAPLALYRRYRPETFAEVIGQEHVTGPLQRALANNRVHHAYLFSGPRGCGKTTSARILARCLNCEKGPTPEPCGTCQSCRDLARNGAGSIDVIEIDAASHGGVNEARDLRERAFFAPVHSRYKIYIIDEAHMVTKDGFNALLKLVEEPPPHVKFIFATTEPDKVLGTIKSRTHHYPFRLVPPATLTRYLADLCAMEHVTVDQEALPLVVRAGAGSVRDSLSVLDQLLGSAGPQGLTYQQAVSLLGYTPDTLLDETMQGLGARNARQVFVALDSVIDSGQDAKRFGEDILQRLRDLIIMAAVPDAVHSGLVLVSADQAERLRAQAAAFGPGELPRVAGIMAKGLTDMRGTSTPRLQLELMFSRALVPGPEIESQDIQRRLDQLEHRLNHLGQSVIAAESAPESRPPTTVAPAGPRSQTSRGGPSSRPAPHAAIQPTTPVAHGVRPVVASAPPVAASAPGTAPAAAAATQPGVRAFGLAELRSVWPRVLDTVAPQRRMAWILLTQNSQIIDVRDGVLTLGLDSNGARDSFNKAGHTEILSEAILAIAGVKLRVETLVAGERTAPQRGRQSAPSRAPASGSPQQRRAPSHPQTPPDDFEPPPDESPDTFGEWAAHPASPSTQQRVVAATARQNLQRAVVAPQPVQPEAEPSRDDISIPDEDESPAELVVRKLGAERIDQRNAADDVAGSAAASPRERKSHVR